MSEYNDSDDNVALRISFGRGNLEKLYKAKELFEQDSKHEVGMDVFIDTLVEAFLSYRNLRGATESQLLQRIASKKNESTI